MTGRDKALTIANTRTDLALSSTKSLMDLTKKILQRKIPQIYAPAATQNNWWDRLIAWAESCGIDDFGLSRGEILREELLSLIDLNLSGYGNRISELPPEIGKLTNLRSFKLSGNSLTHFPPEIGRLTNLEELILGPTIIGCNRTNFKTASREKDISLSANEIAELLPEIGVEQLINLKNFTLQANEIKVLPLEIGKLVNLKKLVLSANEIEYLPRELGQLINLQELNLSINEIRELTPEIGKLINLEKLFLAVNGIKDLPPEIGQLSNLKLLDIRENHISELPSEVKRLKNLMIIR